MIYIMSIGTSLKSSIPQTGTMNKKKCYQRIIIFFVARTSGVEDNHSSHASPSLYNEVILIKYMGSPERRHHCVSYRTAFESKTKQIKIPKHAS